MAVEAVRGTKVKTRWWVQALLFLADDVEEVREEQEVHRREEGAHDRQQHRVRGGEIRSVEHDLRLHATPAEDRLRNPHQAAKLREGRVVVGERGRSGLGRVVDRVAKLL